jgi:hypothetical protein
MNKVSVTTVPEQEGLDTIVAYWHDLDPGKGYVVITCWGSAWTSYFGGMGDCAIKQFFKSASTGYLQNKLGITQWLKTSKRHEVYLSRVNNAVKAHLADITKDAPNA